MFHRKVRFSGLLVLPIKGHDLKFEEGACGSWKDTAQGGPFLKKSKGDARKKLSNLGLVPQFPFTVPFFGGRFPL